MFQKGRKQVIDQDRDQIRCILLFHENAKDIALRLDDAWKNWRSGLDAVECQLADTGIVPATVAWRDELTSIDQMKTAFALSVALDVLPALSILHFAARLGVATGAAQLYWSPAGTMSDATAFAAALKTHETGGLLPLLSLFDLDFSDPMAINTKGLWAFGGREIRYSLAALGKAEVIRRLLRVVQDIVTEGPYTEDCVVPGLDPSERIFISISNDGLIYDIQSVLPSN